MIYLDYAATTPDSVDYTWMGSMIKSYFGNPSSSHRYGRDARFVVEESRQIIAEYLHCDASQLIFTSGATEANNMVITGWAMAQPINAPFEVLYSSTAHHSMTEPAREVYKINCGASSSLRVNEEGLLDENYLENWLNEHQKNNTQILVCFEWVNNETGTIQNAKEIIELCHKYGALVLVDAVQALPTININLTTLGADFVTFSAHKIYGPKGIGLLYMADPTIQLRPLLLGGNQEQKKRAGTENIIGIIGFRAAIQKLQRELYDNNNATSDLQKLLLKTLVANGVNFHLNGNGSYRSPNILNLDCKVEGSALVTLLEEKGFLVSTGAACDGTEERSHVLMAMGLEEAATQSIRISFSGEYTTPEEIKQFAEALTECIKELQI